MSSASPRPHPGAPAGPSPDWLSAAADGDADALDRALRVLREGDAAAAARVRADWHAYHLIGDVLRSSELAPPPGRDAAFMDGLRQRLAAEPVVLAPAAPAAPRAARWRMPAAAVASAAGVAVVAGLLVMARGGDAPGAAVPLAALPQAAPRSEFTASPVLRDGVLRDARIEEFMRVHQGAAGGLSLLPAGVRQVDVVVVPAPQR